MSEGSRRRLSPRPQLDPSSCYGVTSTYSKSYNLEHVYHTVRKLTQLFAVTLMLQCLWLCLIMYCRWAPVVSVIRSFDPNAVNRTIALTFDDGPHGMLFSLSALPVN